MPLGQHGLIVPAEVKELLEVFKKPPEGYKVVKVYVTKENKLKIDYEK